MLFKLCDIEIVNIESIYLCNDHKLLLIKSKDLFSVLDLAQKHIDNILLYQTKISDTCYKIERITGLKFLMLMSNTKIAILELNVLHFKTFFRGYFKKS